MPKTIKKIKSLTFRQAVAYARTRSGEEFHPSYYRDKERFIAMMIDQIRMEKDLKKYFRKTYDEVVEMVGSLEYGTDKKFVLNMVKDIDYWKRKDEELEMIIASNMESAYEYGAEDGKYDLKLDDDRLNAELGKDYASLAKKQAKQINKTTRKIIVNVIEQTEIVQLAEIKRTFVEFLKAMKNKVINLFRPQQIADTETINFFQRGKKSVINFFSKFNKVEKIWRSIPDKRRCSVCANNTSLGWVGKDYLYNTQFGLVTEPPAHGLCRDNVEYRTKT